VLPEEYSAMRKFAAAAASIVLKYYIFIALVFIIWQAASYAKRWCPVGTNPERQPHCLLQPYLSSWAASTVNLRR
jgi:hypothetical protein